MNMINLIFYILIFINLIGIVWIVYESISTLCVLFGFKKIKIKKITPEEFRNFYLRLFLFVGIFFGIYFSLSFFLYEAIILKNFHNMYKEIMFFILLPPISGFLFGATFANVIGRENIKVLKKMPYEDIYNLEPQQTRNIELNYDKAKCFDLCIETLNQMNISKIKTKDFENGKIIAKTKRSHGQWGEIVELELKEVGNNKTKVNVSSKPFSKINIVNCVNNIRNVEEIINYLVTS